MKSDSKTCSLFRHTSFRNASCAGIRESSTSRAESMGATHILSHFEKPENHPSLHESAKSPVPSNRWANRLRPLDSLSSASKRLKKRDDSYRAHTRNALDSLSSTSKRLKKRDDSYRAHTRNLLGIILNYDDCDYYLPKCFEEQKELDSTTLLTKVGEYSDRESKAVSYWIRRWSHGGCLSASLRKLLAPVLCESERSSARHRNSVRKQFPSIAAMALMRAAVKNLNSCRIKRKGSLLVWNTEGS